MLRILICMLAICCSTLFANTIALNVEDQPGLLESLELFFEKQGGDKEALSQMKQEEPLIEVEGAVKNLLHQLSKEKADAKDHENSNQQK